MRSRFAVSEPDRGADLSNYQFTGRGLRDHWTFIRCSLSCKLIQACRRLLALARRVAGLRLLVSDRVLSYSAQSENIWQRLCCSGRALFSVVSHKFTREG